MKMKSKLTPQISAAVTGSLILVSVGYSQGWASPSLAKLQAEDSPIPITSDQGSWIASYLLIGSIIGSIIGIPLVDGWGRKATLLLMTVPLCTSCLLMAFAKSYWWFYLARFIAGFAIGTIYTGIPMYIGEIAEDRVRGGLGILLTVMQNVGLLISFSVGPWVSVSTLAAVGTVVPIVYLMTFAWVPESPYYYAMKSIPNKMESSLTWLRGTHDVNEELQRIRKNTMQDYKKIGVLIELFTMKGNRKALGMIVGLLTCQQLSGNAAITAYSTIIFDQVDSGIDSSISVIVTGVVQLVASIAVVFIADRVGRKPLLLTSILLCGVCLFGEGIFFQLQNEQRDVSSFVWVPVILMIGYLISYAIGLGSVPMVISTEIFPLEVKALAITIGAVYLAAMGTAVTKFYQIISDKYGVHMAFYAFGSSTLPAIFFILFCVPETKGFSFSEIQNLLQGNSKVKLPNSFPSNPI